MFVCIDGSGPSSRAEYEVEFANSFLSQIVRHSAQEFAQRFIGPSMTGGRQVPLDEVADLIRRRYDSGGRDAEPPPVFLGGYSRGAASAVHVAALLGPMGIEVDALFLFDAVDRSPWIGDTLPAGNVDVVPRNVHATYHARRNPAGESRESFDNTATSAELPGTYQQGFFLTTHGGMGGVPFGYTGLETGRHSLGEEYTSWGTSEARRSWIRRHGVLVDHVWTGGGSDLEAVAGLLTGDPTDGFTTLTMEQEEAGALQCIQWMWPHLLRHGVVREGSQPRLATRRGRFGEERF